MNGAFLRRRDQTVRSLRVEHYSSAVNTTKGEEPSFDLGISEIEAATRIARRRGDTWRWRILRVRNALSKTPEIDWLPNPFEEGFKKRYRLHRGGMFVSYVRERD